eukprot:gnl/MRDRNA2_/MRDRNA2_165130_c0_seq1.p1 gnl/MRDRNA2_/MRDRNA2_165130_c0~~gnl/MRDRNA2_/MRDRNA2_165130_c0_seq1.p1  ORF type:complete len:253 (+),score=20.64 gnl/MRDRNA2_/MRDRNA2_165130_c0_seq1:40-798(+)
MKGLHKAGYIHGDIKTDNILYAGVDTRGCPTGLRLTDFGLSFRIGSQQSKYDRSYYAGSWHLPACLFEGQVCQLLGVSSSYSKFIADERIDYCSYTDLMVTFGPAPKLISAKGGNCGPMGPNRRFGNYELVRDNGYNNAWSNSHSKKHSMVPAGWIIKTSRTNGKKYYYNPTTGESQYEKPSQQTSGQAYNYIPTAVPKYGKPSQQTSGTAYKYNPTTVKPQYGDWVNKNIYKKDSEWGFGPEDGPETWVSS